MNPWQELANAVVLQAVEDYRMYGSRQDLEIIEGFFRSNWFNVLTSIDAEQLITLLQKEKGGII